MEQKGLLSLLKGGGGGPGRDTGISIRCGVPFGQIEQGKHINVKSSIPSWCLFRGLCTLFGHLNEHFGVESCTGGVSQKEPHLLGFLLVAMFNLEHTQIEATDSYIFQGPPCDLEDDFSVELKHSRFQENNT